MKYKMKNILKHTIYLILDIIDFISNYKSIEPDDIRKIKEIHNIDLLIQTERGFEKATELNLTNPYHNYTIKTSGNKNLTGAKGHIIVREHYIYDYVENLKIGDKIITKDGIESVIKIKKSNIKSNMIDLSVDNDDNLYYTNGILSHNTISTSIYILWFCLFHDDKGVMIVANKSNTVVEILDKIKSIYKYLPFYLKKGVVNWTQKKVAFDNGCRIQTESRSKEPAIGFTVDLLYFDEFAHIPATIVEPYYRAAIPTISSIEGSKVIITSTPNGFNLFHSLWEGANKDEDDPDKGQYTPLKVMWWQVKGRRDTWVLPNVKLCQKYKINPNDIIKWLKSEGYDMYDKDENGKPFKKIKFDMENEEFTHIDSIRRLRYNSIPLTELCTITNWKEAQTKLINGEENFKQEFDVKFITGDKALFNDVDLERLKNSKRPFKHFSIPIMDKRIKTSYENLKFVDDLSIFDIKRAKDYFIVAGIDFAEGLGKDYTVMTLYKLKMKEKNIINKNRSKYATFYDYFQIEQIGTFRSNHHSIKEFAHIFYLLFFEIFDSEKCKVSFEYNQFGGEFLAHLPNVFEGINNYASSIFARFKHTKDAKISKIGVKLHQNKNSLVKDYQMAIKKQNVIIHDGRIVKEMEIFTRHDTPAGQYTYKAESGNDDCVMSVVNTTTLLNNLSYKDLVQMYIELRLSENDKKFIQNVITLEDDSMVHSYNSIIGSRQKIMSTKKQMFDNKVKNSLFKGNNNPFQPKNIPFRGL